MGGCFLRFTDLTVSISRVFGLSLVAVRFVTALSSQLYLKEEERGSRRRVCAFH